MINPWESELRECAMIKQIQDLVCIAGIINHTAQTLFGLHGQLCRLTDNFFLEANKDEKSFRLAGFREGREAERREQAEKDHQASAGEHEKGPPPAAYIDKDTFLKLCGQIYDQKEVIYADREE